jgi:phosphoribosylanthranilate isomerase
MTCLTISGLTHVDDIVMCAQAGADRLGFVVEHPVAGPWNLSREEAGLLMGAAAGRAMRIAVVGGECETIGDILDVCRPDIVQLHGDEPPTTVAAIASRDVRVIKVIAIPSSAPPGQAEALAAEARMFIDAGADEIMLDVVPALVTAAAEWQLAAAVAAQIHAPVILSGGLRAHNVVQALRAVGPWGVDVTAGVEGDGRRKSVPMVHAFIAAVHDADA